MATLTVTTADDEAFDNDGNDATDGNGLSLREAIGLASAGDTITFDLDGTTAGNQGGTITLGGAELTISENITIDGDLDGDDIPDVTIDADGNSRVFNISGGTNTLDGLTITGGNPGAANGGGILASSSTTTIQNSVISGNTAVEGSAISAGSGSVTIDNTHIANNTSTGNAGAIRSVGDLTITNGSIVGNTSTNVNAISQLSGTLTLTNTTIAQHTGGFSAVQFSGSSSGSITNTTITGNNNVGLSTSFTSGNVTVTDSIIAASSSGSSEPIVNQSGGAVTLSGTNILNQAATGTVGGASPTIQSNLSQIFTSTTTVGGITGGALTTVGNVQIALTQSSVTSGAAPDNEAPVITNPGTLTIDEDDTDAGFSSGAFAIADADNDNQTVTLTVTGGTVSINVASSGVTVTTGDGTDDASLVFNGTLAQVNAALGSMTFSATENLNGTGAASIRIQTSDGIIQGTDDETTTFNITAVADTFTVTTTADSGADATVTGNLAAETADGGGLSLREAIALSDDGDTITFDSGLSGQTVTLGSQLSIGDDITIDGDFVGSDDAADITISGSDAVRIFNITGGTVNLNSLTLTDGNVTNLPVLTGTEQRGGAILVASGATLNVDDTIISSSRAAEGGGIAANGTVNITDSLIMTNSATLSGGGISTFGGAVTISNSTITQNTGAAVGGLITSGGSISVSGSTVTGNRSTGPSATRTDEANGSSGTISFANSIIGNSGGSVNLSGSISFTGPVILTEAFGSSSNVTVATPANIFTATQVVGGLTIGTLADNGGTVQSIAILPTAEGGVAVGTGSGGANVGSGPVVSGNAVPAIAIDGGTLAFTENGNALSVDAAATLSDSDGDAEWNGGTLVAQITGNAEAADQISISDTDGDGIAITVSGTDILANGTDIGDLSASGGTVTGGTALTITFDSDATNANVQEVLQSLRYQNTSNDPGTSDRTITVTATDTNGGAGFDTRTVSVTAEADEPVVSATGANPTFTEDAAATTLYSSASVSTVEAGESITGFNVIARGTADGTNEVLNVDGTAIQLAAGQSGTTATNGISFSVVTSGSDLSVQFTGATLTEAQAVTLFNGITYQNNSNNPTTAGNREFFISDIADSNSITSGGIASTVTVVAANDAPTSADSSPLINDNATRVFTVADFNFSDGDTGDSLQSVRIDTITLTSGTFQLSGVDVTVGQVIAVADITAGNLIYTPQNNIIDQVTNTTPFEFTHSVSDGTAFAASTSRIQVEVSPVQQSATATGAPTDIRVGVETATNVDISSITVADVDSSTALIRISVDTGTLSVGMLPSSLAALSVATSMGMMGSGNSVTIRGTVADVNAFFDDPTLLQYTSASGVTGENAATLTIIDNIDKSNTPLATVNIDIGAAPVTSTPVVAINTDVDDTNLNGGRERGTSLNDRIGGSGGNDTLAGGNGRDTLTGGAGDDFVAGGNGNDVSFAGKNDNGDDTLQGNGGDDILGGGAGDDIIVGGNFGLNVTQFNVGNSGNDTLFGGAGNDLIVGGSYNSVTNTVINTGQGTNIIWAGSGNDTVFGDDNQDTLGGGAGGDLLDGGSGDDTIYGGAGSDTINAAADNDLVFSGAGDDNLAGGSGDDTLFGGAGDDTVSGGAGADVIWAGAGNDQLSGGAGSDTFIFGNTSGNDTVSDFDAGEDILDLSFASTDFMSLAEVTAAASETMQNGQAGVLIDLGDSDSVFVVGIGMADLTTSNVSF